MQGKNRNRFRRKIEDWLDNFSIKWKLIIVYIVCMAIPLVITDSVILGIIYNDANADRIHEYQNMASSLRYNLYSSVDNASKVSTGIYTSKVVDNFLKKEYESPLDYVNNHHKFFSDTLLTIYAGQSNQQLRFYVDNDTIVSGSEFQKLSDAEGTYWYQYMQDNNLETGLCFDFDDRGSAISSSKRKIYYFQKLNFYSKSNNNVLIVELEYNAMNRMLEKMNYDTTIYVCEGDNIILSNGPHNSANKEYSLLEDKDNIGFTDSFNLHGKDLDIHVMKRKNDFWKNILKYFPLILLLLAINILLPSYMVYLINHSFTVRIRELSEAFDGVEGEKLTSIKKPRGQDEIGGLMVNYNKMADRINSLIQIVFKNKIEEQEMIVARQNAELLALHSQINPHFLFNALESIRMHSLIKKERETSEMVEKLAVMQRQYVEWQDDSIKISAELDLVAAYLTLQKYRFGDRLSFELDVEDECKDLFIPKLSIVTFVENACVHGIESKITNGWIFVRIFIKKGMLCLEIEDTGNGIPEEEVDILVERMRAANIDMLKEKGRVGMVNACLRLKMISKDDVTFEVDSEIGVGTMIQVKIPLKYVEKRDGVC